MKALRQRFLRWHLSLLLDAPLLAAGTPAATLLWDPDHPEATPRRVESWGHAPRVVPNPSHDHENPSEHVIAWEKRAQTWEGWRVVLPEPLDLSRPRRLSLRVLAPRLTPLHLTLTSTTEFLESGRPRVLALPGHWHEVSFDLGAQLSGRYDQLTIFVDEANAAPGVWYFDELRLVDDPRAGERWRTAVAQADAAPAPEVFVLTDPDDPSLSRATVGGFPDMPAPQLAADPLQPGRRAWRWERPAGAWAGFPLRLPEPADLRAYTALEVELLAPRAGRLHLMSNHRHETFEWLRSDVAHQPDGNWQSVTIPIPDLYREAGKFQNFHLFINWEEQSAETFWVRRIRLVR